MLEDREAVALERHIVGMYAALGDRAAFDAHLDPNVTIWESDAPDLLDGLTALDELRDRRAAAANPDAAPVEWVRPEEMVADAFGDGGVVRYLLRVRYDSSSEPGTARPDTVFRVTDVLRRRDDRWLIVHHHAQELR
jgi:hypothetical protein